MNSYARIFVINVVTRFCLPTLLSCKSLDKFHDCKSPIWSFNNDIPFHLKMSCFIVLQIFLQDQIWLLLPFGLRLNLAFICSLWRWLVRFLPACHKRDIVYPQKWADARSYRDSIKHTHANFLV